MCWNIKTRMSRLESWVARNLVRFQIVTANLDPVVLQWPGGSLIASLLWLFVMARLSWSVGTVGRLHLQGVQAGSLRICASINWSTRAESSYHVGSGTSELRSAFVLAAANEDSRSIAMTASANSAADAAHGLLG